MKIIIAGAGNVGTYLVERLAAENHSVVVLDQKQQVLDSLSLYYDIQTVLGSSSNVDTLKKAGVKDAEIFIAATDSDEANLISGLFARSLNPDIRNIARVRELSTKPSSLPQSISEVFDQFINPDVEAANFLLRLFEVPGACEVLDFAAGQVRVVGVWLNTPSSIIGRKLRDVRHSEHAAGMLVVAIVRGGQLLIPTGDDCLQLGDTVYAAVKPDRIDAIFEILESERRPIHNVMISGGSGVGRRLAMRLAKADAKVKLIEPDEDRSQSLAAELDNVLVLHGEGTDQELLSQEGIQDVDVFVGATADEEDNILSALLAKRLGATVGAVSLSKLSYVSLMPTIGIDIVINPRIAAASSILKYVRKGAVSSVISLRDDTAEVMEVFMDEQSKIIGRPLRDLKIPPGVIVAAVINENGATIPTGDTIVEAGDNVIFLAKRGSSPKLERMLRVKTSFFSRSTSLLNKDLSVNTDLLVNKENK